jgi:hypothetical protein
MHLELIVTGCYRSGTTLLEKLLHAHPASCVASQPFPALYSYVKSLFDESLGLTRRYPLGHRFLEDHYSDHDFASFLDNHVLSEADLDAVFEQLRRHAEGHWTPEIIGARASIRSGTFVDVYRQLMNEVQVLLPKGRVRLLGSKEVLVEEFVPYALAKGLHAIVIVRDPRDMIASTNFSERDSATGMDRPVLYSIRVWRKSVATALAFEGHPRFHWLRYEDLVSSPLELMTDLCALLQLPAFPEQVLAGRLRDQHGRQWEGNSSFRDQEGVSRESVGRYRALLPPQVQSMIETVAAPEMAILGYSPSHSGQCDLTRYRDPFTRVHAKFPADYSSNAGRVRDELERLERLNSRGDLSEDDARRWFIYPEAYRRLREAVRSR